MHAWMMSALGVHDLNLGYYLPAGSLPVVIDAMPAQLPGGFGCGLLHQNNRPVLTHLAPPATLHWSAAKARTDHVHVCHGFRTRSNKVEVVQLLSNRGHCTLFWPTIPPLQVEPSFACSVSSLSLSPGFQLPGCQPLRVKNLADYLLG